MRTPDFVQIESHPEIGEITSIEELTATEFLDVVHSVPRRDWIWEEGSKSRTELGGIFSVPLKWEMNGSRKLAYKGEPKRLHWRLERYTEDGKHWLKLHRISLDPQETGAETTTEANHG